MGGNLLASAVTEFLRWQRQNGLTERPGEDELAYHLIRITYNRWNPLLVGDENGGTWIAWEDFLSGRSPRP